MEIKYTVEGWKGNTKIVIQRVAQKDKEMKFVESLVYIVLLSDEKLQTKFTKPLLLRVSQEEKYVGGPVQ